jgi:hypothetical protein
MQELYEDYLKLSVVEAAKKHKMTAPTLYSLIEKNKWSKKGSKDFSGRKIALSKVDKLNEYKRTVQQCINIYEQNPDFRELTAGNSWINPLEEHKFYLEHAEEYFEEDFNVAKVVLSDARDQLLKWKRNKKSREA